MSKERKLKIGISLLILLSIVIGTSYAYLEAQLSGEASADIEVNSYTIDVLTFNVKDDLNLEITRENLAQDGENIEKEITATASLIANNKTNSATYNYNLYFLIGKNTLEYTQGEDQPELLLNVYGPDEEEVTSISGLGNQKEINGITGFDITKKSGLITISSNDEITTTNSTEEAWRFKITFVNLETNQVANAGQSFSATVIMQTDPLEDTSLASVCKGQEIGKCFTDNYSLDSTIIHHDGKPDNAEEENYELEAEDDSYRYSGADTDVNNYVCLDSQTTGSCETDDDLYRIIGLFKNGNKYEMKLIKAYGATTTELGDSEVEGGAYYSSKLYKDTYSSYQSSYKGSNWETLAGYYWNNSNGDTSTNMWAESNLNKENLNKFYYNYITTRATYLQNHITEHTWITGGYADSNVDVKEVYENELGKDKLKVGANNCYSQDNPSTARPCTQEDIEYPAHIGLMYVSDYMYGATPDNWSTMAYSYGDAKNNNWMYTSLFEWVISRDSSRGDYARRVDDDGSTGRGYYYMVYLGNYVARPTFYITFDAKLKEGEGNKETPYRITFE